MQRSPTWPSQRRLRRRIDLAAQLGFPLRARAEGAHDANVQRRSQKAEGLGSGGPGAEGAASGGLPPQVVEPFSTAMSQSMLLPVAVLVLGFLSVLAFEQMRHLTRPAPAEVAPQIHAAG